MSRADDNNDLDALFTTDDSNDGGDPFASLSDAANDEFGLPFEFDKPENNAENAAPSGFDFDKSDDALPGFDSAPDAPDAESFATPQAGKKTKKSKKERGVKSGKKEKKAKVAKSEKGPAVRYGSPKPFFVLGAFFLLIILAGNIAAFATAGVGAFGFLVFFDLLGLVLLSVPAMLLWQQTKQRVGLFDVALAFVVACLALGCMAILASQAKTYGGSSKVASVVAQTVDRA